MIIKASQYCLILALITSCTYRIAAQDDARVMFEGPRQCLIDDSEESIEENDSDIKCEEY